MVVAEADPDDPHFRKTHVINRAVRAANQSIIAIIDVDAIIPKQQMVAALRSLAQGTDIVYPHEGSFFDVPRSDCGLIAGDTSCTALIAASKHYRNLNAVSVGGGVLFKRTVFWSGGGMNERFETWGREDVEFKVRFGNLGYVIERIPGPVFHLTHPRPADNGFYKPDNSLNVAECDRISAMSRHELLDEIARWSWAHA